MTVISIKAVLDGNGVVRLLDSDREWHEMKPKRYPFDVLVTHGFEMCGVDSFLTILSHLRDDVNVVVLMMTKFIRVALRNLVPNRQTPR